jgi:exosome complex exonuclease DIS3/RRP44
MLDEPSNSNPVNLSVNLLNYLAKILRKRRIDTGALTLASPEVKFKLDTESLNPVGTK